MDGENLETRENSEKGRKAHGETQHSKDSLVPGDCPNGRTHLGLHLLKEAWPQPLSERRLSGLPLDGPSHGDHGTV